MFDLLLDVFASPAYIILIGTITIFTGLILGAKQTRATTNLWVLGSLAILSCFGSGATAFKADRDKTDDAEKHKIEIYALNRKLDESSTKLASIADCFTLHYDPNACAAIAQILNKANGPVTKKPESHIESVGLPLSDQLSLISNRALEVAGDLRQAYKTSSISQQEFADKMMRQMEAAGSSHQGAYQATHPTTGSGVTGATYYARSRNKAIIQNRHSEIEELVHGSSVLLSDVDETIVDARASVLKACSTARETDVESCAKSLEYFAQVIKPK